MYIEIYNEKEQFAMMSKKLTSALNYKKGYPSFLQIVELKGENTFALIKREPKETFKTQCSMVHRKNRRGKFHFTIPSLEFICAIMDIPDFTRKILRVKQCSTPNGLTYYKLCK